MDSNGDQASTARGSAGSRETDTGVTRSVIATARTFHLTLGNTLTGHANTRDGFAVDRRVTGGSFTIFARFHDAVSADLDQLAIGIAVPDIGRLAFLAWVDRAIAADRTALAETIARLTHNRTAKVRLAGQLGIAFLTGIQAAVSAVSNALTLGIANTRRSSHSASRAARARIADLTTIHRCISAVGAVVAAGVPVGGRREARFHRGAVASLDSTNHIIAAAITAVGVKSAVRRICALAGPGAAAVTGRITTCKDIADICVTEDRTILWAIIDIFERIERAVCLLAGAVSAGETLEADLIGGGGVHAASSTVAVQRSKRIAKFNEAARTIGAIRVKGTILAGI